MNLTSITSGAQKEEGMDGRLKAILVMALLVAAVAGAIGVAARVVSPQDEIDSARAAIETARSAQAEQYEAELIQRAQSDFQSALAEVEEQDQRIKLFRSYKKAEPLLISAAEGAREAYKKTVATKREAQAAAATIELACIQVKTDWESLEWVVDKFSLADVNSMKNTLKELDAEVQRARQLLDEQDYAGAKAAADSVVHQSNEIARKLRQAT